MNGALGPADIHRGPQRKSLFEITNIQKQVEMRETRVYYSMGTLGEAPGVWEFLF